MSNVCVPVILEIHDDIPSISKNVPHISYSEKGNLKKKIWELNLAKVPASLLCSWECSISYIAQHSEQMHPNNFKNTVLSYIESSIPF